MINMENKNINNIEDNDFNITDHIIKKDKTNWEDKWNKTPTREDDDPFVQQPKTYSLYLRPICQFEHVPIKSNEPWYRRFENKRKKGGKKCRY